MTMTYIAIVSSSTCVRHYPRRPDRMTGANGTVMRALVGLLPTAFHSADMLLVWLLSFELGLFCSAFGDVVAVAVVVLRQSSAFHLELLADAFGAEIAINTMH
ncbi:unnamed protein product [Polarella glacialis]|uniref:Uncharacterized protein n=1 Tax=Polarella glacialis TaxID=89957 RepID=A0A813L2H7_POLGL|nr:unnamed protein product [Polarella glacialis]